ncbi:hypothetical protein FHT71_003698 [Rhizobium sp. BK060]|nr:hypothetical protein [Rhizobium sp. BK060]
MKAIDHFGKTSSFGDGQAQEFSRLSLVGRVFISDQQQVANSVGAGSPKAADGGQQVRDEADMWRNISLRRLLLALPRNRLPQTPRTRPPVFDGDAAPSIPLAIFSHS